ncbi:hypothetical protein [Paenibacillus fonticola]|uniref:hypothetical protein n=1 Tax=Paenibacillus fonticola TaxID=379896 RepID=UPI000363E938|nr:hypothetical protein [Paenibacillus fonticola]
MDKFKFCICGNQTGAFKQLGSNGQYVVSLHECGGVVIDESLRKESNLEKITSQQATYIELLEKKNSFLLKELNKSEWPK